MLLQDLGYGLRTLLRQRTFSAIAVLTLALGIGANSAIFSVVHSVLLRPLPYPNEDRLVTIWHHYRTLERADVSPPNFVDYRAQNHTLDGVAAMAAGSFNLSGDAEPERVLGARISASFFSVLGVAPAVGRALRPEENEPGRDAVVVLSDGLWRRRYGADPGIVGKDLDVDGKRLTVVGILPRAFELGSAEIWMPLVLNPEQLTEDERGDEYSR